MVPLVDGSARTIPRDLEWLLALVDDVHEGLKRIQPGLSAGQLEEMNNFMLRDSGFVHNYLQMAVPSVVRAGNIEDLCQEILEMVGPSKPPSSANFMVRALSSLHLMAGRDTGQFVACVWHLVALPVEQGCKGRGWSILRACMPDFGCGRSQGGVASVRHGSALQVVMDYAVISLRLSGHLPQSCARELCTPGEKQALRVLTPSNATLHLGVNAAAYLLSSVKGTTSSVRGCDDSEDMTRWKMKLHVEVSTL